MSEKIYEKERKKGYREGDGKEESMVIVLALKNYMTSFINTKNDRKKHNKGQ